ncbi:hypothetical protein KP79_PYT19285 [Mizuhopecten yessoensis]|uniref:Uncharacterized protein n=1 Tax=Mizuhopecten yessoensis TaxID=6573 RepID=A0A210PGF1_MIZYE|nr:hypothetical protein KP79_PYT19285 [Mizuhopecten yessoensis]
MEEIINVLILDELTDDHVDLASFTDASGAAIRSETETAKTPMEKMARSTSTKHLNPKANLQCMYIYTDNAPPPLPPSRNIVSGNKSWDHCGSVVKISVYKSQASHVMDWNSNPIQDRNFDDISDTDLLTLTESQKNVFLEEIG